MWFKNLTLFRFTEPCSLTAEILEKQLEERRFQPCGTLDAISFGWCAPLGKDSFPLVHATGGFLMVCLQREEKIVPSSVVNEIVGERAAEIEEAQGRSLRKKERDAIRDEVMHDLLPRAFSFSRRLYAYIDTQGGWLIVDAASAKKAEELASLLRQCLGSLPVVPLTTRERPAAVMTQWLMEKAPPSDIALEDECELRSSDEDGGIVRCRRHDLAAPEIQNHLEAGKEAIKLAFTWNERISILLDDGLSVKRLKFLELVQDEAASVETDDPVERFDADFAVMSHELAAFLPRLAEIFGGENVQSKN